MPSLSKRVGKQGAGKPAICISLEPASRRASCMPAVIIVFLVSVWLCFSEVYQFFSALIISELDNLLKDWVLGELSSVFQG